jgi:galactitol-specific phosphotransferase system IIB component
MMIRLSKVLLSSALLLTLTACGGGSSTTITVEDQEASLEKIISYAEDSSIVPVKEDYINAGVDSNDLNFVDIDELNSLVQSKDSTEVDSEEELNSLVQSIMDKVPPVITLNGSSVETVLLNTNYTELGATAIDNKDGEVKVNMTGVVDISKEGNYTRTYEASDRFNNTAIVTRTVNVIAEDKDIEAPTLTISANSIKEQGDLASIVTAIDNIDGDVEVRISGDTNTSVVGVHTVIYSASDSAGNEVRKEVDIIVIPFTVHELITKGKSGELDDVSYHVIGDSTRNYPDKDLTVLVDSYYQEKVTSNIQFSHSAYAGQRVEYWLDNNEYIPELFTEEETFAILADKNKVKNPSHCIVEFSMGINDFIHEEHLEKDELKLKIKQAISDLQSKNVHVLLVSPVPYYDTYLDNRPETSVILNDLYEELRVETGLNISFVSGYDAMLDGYPNNTIDNLHPTNEGLKDLADKIFEQIENDSLN